MIIVTKSDEKRHYVNCMFDFAEVLYEYLGQDTVDAFREFIEEAYEKGQEDAETEEKDDDIE